MTNTATDSSMWHLLVNASKRALVEKGGYKISRMPGRGLSNLWEAQKDGKKAKISIRTSQDRWFAFQPLKEGSSWKTLDIADFVAVATVDNIEDPQKIEVYLFPGEEVRKRFHNAYTARSSEGKVVPDNFGMWINLDKDPRGGTYAVGSGLSEAYPQIAEYDIAPFDTPSPDDNESTENEGVNAAKVAPATIAEVIEVAKAKIAEIAGVPAAAVRLDLKIEY